MKSSAFPCRRNPRLRAETAWRADGDAALLEADRRGGVSAGAFATTPRNGFVWGALIFAASLAAFLWGIDSAGDIYFDETWYVPDRARWLKSGEMLHQEHPPLGKLLIAVGLWLFGDNPLGWRAMSALFGAIDACRGLSLDARAASTTSRAALWTAAVTFCNAILFVQARIAMLDIFLMAFCMPRARVLHDEPEGEARRRRSLALRVWRWASASASPARANGRAFFSVRPHRDPVADRRCCGSGACASTTRGPSDFYAPERPAGVDAARRVSRASSPRRSSPISSAICRR